MSWILGCFGKNIESYKDKILAISQNAKFKFNSENYFIIANGIKGTCFGGKVEENKNFVSVGIGIKNYENKISFLQNDDWSNLLKDKNEEILNLNGHFTVIEFSKEKLIVRSDSFGMRELYYFKDNDNLIFSTRTDFLTRVKNNVSLNINQFGSNWLLNFQLNFKIGIDDIKRIGPGGTLIFENNTINKSNSIWQPKVYSKINENQFFNSLKNFSIFPLENNDSLSLALSGGLDSRLLFSILTTQHKTWSTHTFGESNHPDVNMANKIAEYYEIEIQNYINEINTPNEIIKLLETFFMQTPPIIPAYEILNANLNKKVYEQQKIIIDGCCGEIFRRQYFYGLEMKGRKNLIDFNPNELLKYFKGIKADIFNDEATRIMELGCLEDISSIQKYLPKVEEDKISDWIDLFSIIYKMPNIFGPLQTFADNISIAYIPFVQKDILDINFNIKIDQRKNGILFKEIIKHTSPELTKFPLIKNNVKYPFSSGSLSQRIFLKAKNKFGEIYNSGEDQLILHLLKDYIYDEINSTNFKNFDFYDHNKITMLVNNYYSGQTNLSMQLNWFLSFNTWRKFNLTNEVK